jgi:hypothetical protein
MRGQVNLTMYLDTAQFKNLLVAPCFIESLPPVRTLRSLARRARWSGSNRSLAPLCACACLRRRKARAQHLRCAAVQAVVDPINYLPRLARIPKANRRRRHAAACRAHYTRMPLLHHRQPRCNRHTIVCLFVSVCLLWPQFVVLSSDDEFMMMDWSNIWCAVPRSAAQCRTWRPRALAHLAAAAAAQA